MNEWSTLMTHALVPVKSALLSKINWSAMGLVIVSLLMLFGVDMDEATKANISNAISVLVGLVIMALRTWFSPTVTAQSLPPKNVPLV